MIRIALVSDTHSDEASRLDEHQSVMAWLLDDMASRGVDLIAHGGDWWERECTTLVERRAVQDWVRGATEIAPLVTCSGNHDNGREVEHLARLRTAHPVHAFTRPGVISVAGLAVGVVPWPRAAQLLAALGRPVSHEESGVIAQDCLRSIFRGLRDQMEELGGPRFVLGHLMIDGAHTDHDQPIVGADMAVSLADLALLDADFIAAGHIHAHNDWLVGRAPAVYPGAPMHRNFGEAGPGKGYVIVEIDPFVCGCAQGYKRGACPVCENRGAVSWERIVSNARSMLLFEEDWERHWDYQVHGCEDDPPAPWELAEVKGAEVRFRYGVKAEDRDSGRAAAGKIRDQLLERGAALVKLEEQVRATQRAKSPEVARAVTLADKIAAYWAAKADVPPPERRTRLLSKLAQLETEVRDAA